MHAPTLTRAVHGYKDSPDLCRCGGTDGRAAVGHMPGSCLCASVRALLTGSLGAQRARSRRRMPHIGGMCNQGGFASKASPPSVLTQVLPSLTGSAKQSQAKEAPRKTLALRILALKLWF